MRCWEDKYLLRRTGLDACRFPCIAARARPNDHLERDGPFAIALEFAAQIAFVFI
jgi:hypothetical protein